MVVLIVMVDSMCVPAYSSPHSADVCVTGRVSLGMEEAGQPQPMIIITAQYTLISLHQEA